MKKLIVAVALSFVSALALAHGNGNGGTVAGGVAIGGIAGGFAGSTTGTAKVNSNGSAVAASQVLGSGFSNQHTDAATGGTAVIGGAVNFQGAGVSTSTTQFATVNSVGATDQAALNTDGLIQNGTLGIAQTESTAKGTAKFDTAAVGGGIAVGGIAGVNVSGFHGFAPF